MSYTPLSASCYDVIVVGAGYAGFAAALSCHRAGRSTLLVDRRAALLAESGWSFARESGDSLDPLWREWQKRLAPRGVSSEGAISEVLATDLVIEESLPVLYYAAPVAVDRLDDGNIAAVTVATKAGLRRLRARQWIDATDDGELARLTRLEWRAPEPVAQTVNLFFRHARPTVLPAFNLPVPAGLPAGASLEWTPGGWTGEQVLSIRLPGTHARACATTWLPALRALHAAAADDLRSAVLTHGSVVPCFAFPRRNIEPDPTDGLPPNVCFAGASGETLAEKFGTGVEAAQALAARPAAPREGTFGSTPVCIPHLALEKADVGIAGLGTGGALAAIAAARAGAKVCAADAMPFPGGVGTGSGLHVYYFGVKGGLQEEVDARVRELMPLFGAPAQVGGFHPEAKKQALGAMLTEAGVTTCYEAFLHTVSLRGAAVATAGFATRTGPMQLCATAWVDATGDGDLAAKSGARFRLGRCGDGLLHAYGQSCGRARLVSGTAKLQIINFDAGFCDSTDEQDLTRARLHGVRQYVQERYDSEIRPTYIAPLIGIRQSRQIEADYTLSLDDLINRQRFPDAIGYTGCHYDNHARDYEFETDEAAFWVWVCQQWYGRLASEIPFRMLLPRGLENVLMACRAAGVSEEAHHSFRMQRDMQRIGEAAGIAAACASRHGGDCRNVPITELQPFLVQSGALELTEFPDRSFGQHAGADYFEVASGRLDGWIAELRGGPATEALWHLYRTGSPARRHVEPLLEAEDDTVSWRSAAILAMWGDERAEPRLLRAIRSQEDDRTRDITKPQQAWFYMPRWYAALTLLKRCVTLQSLPQLEELAATVSLELNARNAVALASEALARRHGLPTTDRQRIEYLLQALLASAAPQSRRSPQGSPLGRVEPPSVPQPTDLRPVIEDYTWQLHLAVLRARLALGLTAHAEARQFLHDNRALVRRAFGTLLMSEGGAN